MYRRQFIQSLLSGLVACVPLSSGAVIQCGLSNTCAPDKGELYDMSFDFHNMLRDVEKDDGSLDRQLTAEIEAAANINN